MDRSMTRARKNAAQNNPGRKKQKHSETLQRAVRYALGAVLLLVFMSGLFGQNGYLALRRAHADVKKLHKEIDQLNEQNHQLSGDVHALKTDPAAVERVAREDMGLARPGELVFRLPETPKSAPAAPEPK